MNKNIICTLGPASERKETIMEMADAGMGMVRINFSHGDHHQHQRIVNTIREINETYGYDIKILQDLEGYRIRIAHLERAIRIEKNQHVWISNASASLRGTIPLDSDINFESLVEGMCLFINDGMIALRIIRCEDEKIELVAESGGLISSKKGVNIPELPLGINILTEKDKEDIAFSVANKVDYIAQSFVRNKQDMQHVVNMVKPDVPVCRFIAKIENREGVEHIESIMEACDGIMIARGDLGVSLPIYQIPFIQKDIIRQCARKARFVITATQMLESMTEHPRPTRAEVSDVANAILDGSDYVMLSGETAIGRFPVESVKMMRQIVAFATNRMQSGDG